MVGLRCLTNDDPTAVEAVDPVGAGRIGRRAIAAASVGIAHRGTVAASPRTAHHAIAPPSHPIGRGAAGSGAATRMAACPSASTRDASLP